MLKYKFYTHAYILLFFLKLTIDKNIHVNIPLAVIVMSNYGRELTGIKPQPQEEEKEEDNENENDEKETKEGEASSKEQNEESKNEEVDDVI